MVNVTFPVTLPVTFPVRSPVTLPVMLPVTAPMNVVAVTVPERVGDPVHALVDAPVPPKTVSATALESVEPSFVSIAIMAPEWDV